MAADDQPRDPHAEEARDLLRTCEAELAANPDVLGAARLHYEMAVVWEETLDDLAKAASHYKEALSRAPEHLPSIRGARRVHRARGEHRDALPLFDAEIRLASEPRRKALLFYEKGCLFENDLHDLGGAREAYLSGLDLDHNNPSLLKAVERLYARADDRAGLARNYAQLSNTIAEDVKHRAALMIGHARLLPDDQTVEKIELYEGALRLDPQAPGALESLKRLYHLSGRWQKLIEAFEREAEQTEDDTLRALALYRIGVIYADRVGSRAEAIQSLEAAAAVNPGDRLVLEDLVRLYEADENHTALARILELFVDTASEPAEKLSLFHRLGRINETRLDNENAALRWYTAALEIDPTFVPGLQALGKLLRERADWAGLVAMHLAEANASDDPHRRADAHARVAEICEVNLDKPAEAAEHHERALALQPGYPASFKALSRLYIQSGQFRKLVELYERAVDQGRDASHKIAYLFKIGAVWEDALDDPLQASHAYRRALELDPDSLRAIHALQRVYERADRHRELVETLELEASKVEDTELRVSLLHRAGTVLDEYVEDREAAVLRFRKVLELNPTFVPALASLGRICYRDGRWADLLEMYKRELRVTPAGPAALTLLYRMGEVCETRLGHDEEAIEYYRRCADMDPSHRPAIRSLIRLLEAGDQWVRLPEVLELEVRGTEDPEAKAAIFFRMGRVFETRIDEPFKAAAAYEKALLEAPTYRPAIDAISRVHAERRAWQQLVEDLARDEKNTQDPMRRAAALMRQGEVWRDKLNEPARAVACFEELLAIDSSYLPAWLALEPLHAKTGNWKALAATYRKQASLFQSPAARVAALRELARIQEGRGVGTTEDVVATYDKILKLAPDDHAALLALERIGRASKNRVLLTRVEARLGASAEDGPVAAYHFTSLGKTLEGVSDDIALDSYRGALAKDPENLTAMRGIARVAARIEDYPALADALRRQAAASRRGEVAAELLVRSGAIASQHLKDSEAALADLERALEAWPDGTAAVEQITAILSSTGELERLVDLLSRAAGTARSPERIAALWIDVAHIYSTKLDNNGAAIATLKRALESVPNHVATNRLLAEMYITERQWDEARKLYERVAELATNPEVVREVKLALAALYDEHLGDADGARESVQAILETDATNPEALARMVEIQQRSGELKQARATARQLVELATGTETHAESLLRLARLDRMLGDHDASVSTFLEAVVIAGPSGDAGLELEELIAAGHGNWSIYADAISGYLEEERAASPELASAFLKLAVVQAEMLEDNAAAVATLQRGIEATDADAALVSELAKRLGTSGKPEDAARHLRGLLDSDVSNTGTWRALHDVLAGNGKDFEAELVAGPLAVLQQATGSERDQLLTRARARTNPRPGSFGLATLEKIAAHQALSIPAARLLAALLPAVHKLHPADLDALGLSKRDRIPSRAAHATRSAADEMAAIFDVREYDLYEHMLPEPLVSVETAETPGLVVAEALTTLQENEQAFLLGYAMASIAGQFFPAIKLSAREIELLLTAAARLVSPSYGAEIARPNVLDELAQRLRKAIPRKWRKPVEEATRRYLAKPCKDFEAWTDALEQTAMRAASLICGDLLTAINLLRRHESRLAELEGTALVDGSELVADLLRFWVSETAMACRRSAGLLPTTAR